MAEAGPAPAFSHGGAAADLPVIAYCATLERAKALVFEVQQDAAGWPIGLDIETAPLPAEAARLSGLILRQAELKGQLRAARMTHAPEFKITAFQAEQRLVAAQIKYAETAGLDPYRGRIRLVQLYGGGSRVAVIDVFRAGEGVLRLLDGVPVVAHNAAFELSWFEHAGVELGEIHCTMQGARLTLGENAMSLADAAGEYLGAELDKAEQQSDWSAPNLTADQLNYAARDAVTVFRLSKIVLRSLGQQSPAYEIQTGVTPAVVRMKARGIWLDLDAHAKFIQSKKNKRVETCEAYKAACADRGLLGLAAKIPATPDEKRAILEAILTSDELAQWTRTEKTGSLSTARNELKKVAFRYPPIMALVELSKIDKILVSFGPTLTALVSPVTGRIHSNYLVAGTASGRATCSYPNLQQAPRDKEFRACFRAAHGHKFVGADFSSMELRAIACISGDQAMMRAFREGKDLHKITASRMLSKSEDNILDEERRAAKAVNFGSIYGIGPTSLVKAAWDQYDVVLTENEAAQWLNTVRRAYPDLDRWRYDHYEKCKADGKIVIGKQARLGIGRFYPLTRLPKGVPNAYTRACNLPVQGACADAAMLALTSIDQALFDAGIDGGPVAWLHDEIILEVAEHNAERAKALLERAMIEAFAETFPGAPLNGLVEARIGDTWAAVKG